MPSAPPTATDRRPAPPGETGPAAPPPDDRFDEVYDRVILASTFFEVDGYYGWYRDRYRNTFRHLARVWPTLPGSRLLDVGSGQFALLAAELLGAQGTVADIDTRYREDLDRRAIDVVQVDLTQGGLPGDRRFDAIVFAEVLEHVPRPPRTILADLRDALTPGGVLVLTTPNVFRLRNVVRMVAGRPIFDPFEVPRPDAPLGHFVEYSLAHVRGFAEAAGFEIVHADLEQLSLGGASRGARLARRLTAPLVTAVPRLRDNVVVVARRPGLAT